MLVQILVSLDQYSYRILQRKLVFMICLSNGFSDINLNSPTFFGLTWGVRIWMNPFACELEQIICLLSWKFFNSETNFASNGWCDSEHFTIFVGLTSFFSLAFSKNRYNAIYQSSSCLWCVHQNGFKISIIQF